MTRKIVLVLALFTSIILHSQVVINELNADNPSTDDHEFIELKSITPNLWD